MNQKAFQKAVDEEFGPSFGEAIPRGDIEESMDSPDADCYRIMMDGEWIGGAVIQDNGKKCSLDLMFVDPDFHGRGIGKSVWDMIEKMYPDAELWETHTPYFEKRNIHFYVNKCGFCIVEFYCDSHPDPDSPDVPGGDLFFRFEKKIDRT